MAKVTYESSPFYTVRTSGGPIVFNYFGRYTTANEAEIKVLDGLAPRYVTVVEREKPKPKPAPKKAPAKPKAKKAEATPEPSAD